MSLLVDRAVRSLLTLVNRWVIHLPLQGYLITPEAENNKIAVRTPKISAISTASRLTATIATMATSTKISAIATILISSPSLTPLDKVGRSILNAERLCVGQELYGSPRPYPEG